MTNIDYTPLLISLEPLVMAVLNVGIIGTAFLLAVTGVVFVFELMGYDPIGRFNNLRRESRYRARYERESERQRYREWKKERGF
jgi:hypothetical protein